MTKRIEKLLCFVLALAIWAGGIFLASYWILGSGFKTFEGDEYFQWTYWGWFWLVGVVVLCCYLLGFAAFFRAIDLK